MKLPAQLPILPQKSKEILTEENTRSGTMQKKKLSPSTCKNNFWLKVLGLPKLENPSAILRVLPKIFPGSNPKKNVLCETSNHENKVGSILYFDNQFFMQQVHKLNKVRIYKLPDMCFYDHLEKELNEEVQGILFAVDGQCFMILPFPDKGKWGFMKSYTSWLL